MTTETLKHKLDEVPRSEFDTAKTSRNRSTLHISMTGRRPPPRSIQDTLSNEMAQHESSGFKNAADKAAYELDYAEQAKDHQAEEQRFINNDRDAILFQNVRHSVLIAGFKHSHQEKGTSVSRGRNISSAALAGYCGQLYITELTVWFYEKRVVIVFKALQAIEVYDFIHTPLKTQI